MKNKYKYYIKIFFVALFLEIIIFNITSYRNIFGKYKKIEYLLDEITYIEINNQKKAIYEINNINIPICSIKLILNCSNDTMYNYSFEYSDETTNDYLFLYEKTYIKSIEKSTITPTYLSGNVSKIKLYIDEDVYNDNLLDRVIINESIPFDFNFIRFLCILFVLFTIKFIKESNIINKNYSNRDFKQELILIGVVTIFICIIGYINSNSKTDVELNMYNKGMVDSLLQGKTYLLNEPTDAFFKLENPYDTYERKSVIRDIDYIWDSAYYNGHQYVYFGILPIFLMFLPYYLITGIYLKTEYVVFIFSILCLILLKSILLKLINTFFKKIPYKIVLFSLIILLSGCLIIYLNGTPRFYEVAIISGLYFVLQGIWFILEAINEDKINYLFIFLGCLCLALSVACRPIDLIASFLILPILIKIFICNCMKLKNTESLTRNRKNIINFIVFISSVTIPYLVVGVSLMYYNYIRFDNVFEFGAKYQLTINNMMSLGSRLFVIPCGLICNLFSIPLIIPNFPFLMNHNNLMNFNGYYYIEDMIGGLFILCPICFINFYIFKLKNKIKNKKLFFTLITLNIVACVITIMSIMMAGSNQRYLVDYAWMFILSAILVFISIYKLLKTDEAKRIMLRILTIIACYTLIINIFAGILSENDFFNKNSKEEYDKLKYTICFWE